jgi:hypothetical protein
MRELGTKHRQNDTKMRWGLPEIILVMLKAFDQSS